MLINTYLEQACYSSIKHYSSQSSTSIWTLLSAQLASLLSYLIHGMHCQLEHASRAESSTVNLCSFLTLASWRCNKLSVWSLGSENLEWLGTQSIGLAHWVVTVHIYFVFFFPASRIHILLPELSVYFAVKICAEDSVSDYSVLNIKKATKLWSRMTNTTVLTSKQTLRGEKIQAHNDAHRSWLWAALSWFILAPNFHA